MKFIYTFIFLFISAHLFAQVDKGQKSVPIPPIEVKEEKAEVVPPAVLTKPEEKPSLSNKTSGLTLKSPMTIKKNESDFSMMDKSDLIDPGTIFEDKWAKQKKDKLIRPEFMTDQFLGDFRSNGEFANIICRDHEYPDGDRVRVFVNDDVVISDLLLTENFKSFKIPLQPGINKITFQALNQGESGPNTAAFQVYDDKETLISSKEWNLLTGVKAIIVIVKE